MSSPPRPPPAPAVDADSRPYSISPFSPLCSGCMVSDALLRWREQQLSCFRSISYALYDAFIVLISSIDAQCYGQQQRDMLRTVTDSVRGERDNFTQYLADINKLPSAAAATAAASSSSFSSSPHPLLQWDVMDLYRLQHRLLLHYRCWNRAIAELYSFFFPVRPHSAEANARMASWARRLEEQRERGEREEVEARERERADAAERAAEEAEEIELKDLHHSRRASRASLSSSRSASFDGADEDEQAARPARDGDEEDEARLSTGASAAVAAAVSPSPSMPPTPFTNGSFSPDVSSLGGSAVEDGEEGGGYHSEQQRPRSSRDFLSSFPEHPDREVRNQRQRSSSRLREEEEEPSASLQAAVRATLAFQPSELLPHSRSADIASLTSASSSASASSTSPVLPSGPQLTPSQSASPATSPVVKPTLARVHSRSASPMPPPPPALAPPSLSFPASLFPPPALLPSVPQVGPESLFSAIAPHPSSSVDFLRPSSSVHRHLPPLPYALPVFVHDEEPASIIAYALAALDHLQAVDRVQPADLPLLRHITAHYQQRDAPAYILPSQQAISEGGDTGEEAKAARRNGSSSLHIKTSYFRPLSPHLSPWSKGGQDLTPGSGRSPSEPPRERDGSRLVAHAASSSAVAPVNGMTAAVNGSMAAAAFTAPVLSAADLVPFLHSPPEHLTLQSLYQLDPQRDSSEAIERLLRCDDRQHLKLSFDDAPPSSSSSSSFPASDASPSSSSPSAFSLFSSHPERTSFTCTLYHPVQFHALRLFFCDGDYSFLSSLCHSSRWSASGGRSGSTFSKTRDERFVLKFVKRQQLLTLLDIALPYFSYLSQHAFHHLPSFLVPILGAYELSWRRGRGEAKGGCCVLVMSHLFTDRLCTLVFDLKGSSKNRYVKKKTSKTADSRQQAASTGIITVSSGGTTAAQAVDEDEGGMGLSSASLSSSSSLLPEVLLDDNLMELTHQLPLPLTATSASLCKMAFNNDTLFLSSLHVIDYSCLLGLNTATRHAVFGLIDYCRLFNSAERLESSIKSLGSSREPTVIPPQAYRQRFRAAMDRFFNLAAVDITGAAERDGRRHSEETADRKDDLTAAGEQRDTDTEDEQSLVVEQLDARAVMNVPREKSDDGDDPVLVAATRASELSRVVEESEVTSPTAAAHR